jgi:hypothetical protein
MKALFARRNFPGQHAELIEVPIAHDHRDLGPSLVVGRVADCAVEGLPAKG